MLQRKHNRVKQLVRREDIRSLQSRLLFRVVIQLVECYIWDVVVAGSNPVYPTVSLFSKIKWWMRIAHAIALGFWSLKPDLGA